MLLTEQTPGTLDKTMTSVTHILESMERGDRQAAAHLLPLVYDELRTLAANRLSQERSGQTLQATALVHEAYLRLVDGPRGQAWEGRGHFFAAAAEAMRRILIENARRKGRLKRGGRSRRINLEQVDVVDSADGDELLDLNDALERLSKEDHGAGEIAKLRLFAGLSVEQAGEAAGCSRSTAYEHWAYARAWLHAALNGSSGQPGSE